MPEPVIRLFISFPVISSPADVSAERQRATMAAERLNGEFAGRVRTGPVPSEEHFFSHAGSRTIANYPGPAQPAL